MFSNYDMSLLLVCISGEKTLHEKSRDGEARLPRGRGEPVAGDS
jgi:hypothetical protein